MKSRAQNTFFGREVTREPSCPFCGLHIQQPMELKTRRPGEMPLGSCTCGAVYSFDVTGHLLGSAFIEALVFACNMDWDLAWSLLPQEDYLEEIVENYDLDSHLIIPGGAYEGRRISGTLYFIRMHQEIQEIAGREVQRRLASATPVAPPGTPKKLGPKMFSKKEVEEHVINYRLEPLLVAAARDKRIIHDLQRLIYSPDLLLRSRAADILGKVAAVIAQRDPGTISNLMQRLLNTFNDPGASSWGAIDTIGEIIGNSPDLFAGHVPTLNNLLNDTVLRPKVLKAIGRAAETKPSLIKDFAFRYIPFLEDPDPETRGYAARLLGCLGTVEARKALDKLLTDTNELAFYQEGDIKQMTVAEIAAEALGKLPNK